MTTSYDRTELQITDDILSNIPDTYQKTVGYPIWDIIKAFSYEIKSIWDNVSVVNAWGDIKNLKGDFLTRWCYQRRGILRKDATFAETVLTGTGETTVPKGSVFASESGLIFESTKEVESVNNVVQIPVVCRTGGKIGNLPSGSISKIPVTIQGLVSVVNEVNAQGGYDSETDEELIQRYTDDLQKPITSGNIYHYEKWAKECAGVGGVKVKPLWNGDNTVKVIIIDNNGLPAADELVETVQNYIDPNSNGKGEGQAPTGAYCSVEKASSGIINVSAKVVLKAGSVLDEVIAQIREKLNDYFKSIAFKSKIVSYAQINSQILLCDNVKDLENLLLNGDTNNIETSETDTSCEVAILGELNITK